jgi:aspartyl-tRNA(Asn)/glutamyl-tRNA(Gln) amidotransferase subunit A
VNPLVLVVDDEPDVEVLFRQQFRRDLRAGRFTMEFAQSAADGVPAPANLRGLRFAVPSTVFQVDVSPAVADAFKAALVRLSAAGATVVELPMAEFAQAAAVSPRGALISAEAYSWHRQWMKDKADKYDPRVLVRIRAGETITAADYIQLLKLREQFIRTINAAASGYDAMLMPTTPDTAPTIAETSKDDETYFRLNLRMVRNTIIVNLFDGCVHNAASQAGRCTICAARRAAL